MTIDQLQASMKHITGVDWMSGNKLLWDEYRTSLGVPDYQETVNEDLSANVIFQKFLQMQLLLLSRMDRARWFSRSICLLYTVYDEHDPATVDNMQYLRRLCMDIFQM